MFYTTKAFQIQIIYLASRGLEMLLSIQKEELIIATNLA